VADAVGSLAFSSCGEAAKDGHRLGLRDDSANAESLLTAGIIDLKIASVSQLLTVTYSVALPTITLLR